MKRSGAATNDQSAPGADATNRMEIVVFPSSENGGSVTLPDMGIP